MVGERYRLGRDSNTRNLSSWRDPRTATLHLQIVSKCVAIRERVYTSVRGICNLFRRSPGGWKRGDTADVYSAFSSTFSSVVDLETSSSVFGS